MWKTKVMKINLVLFILKKNEKRISFEFKKKRKHFVKLIRTRIDSKNI